MIPILTLWSVLVAGPVAAAPAAPVIDAPDSAAAASVTALHVRAVETSTEVLIELDRPADLRDYLLTNPVRLVVDVSGARHALPRDRFPSINRGGITGVRTSQFSPEVVRVVIELERPVEYTVDAAGGGIRIRFDNPSAPFESWHTSGAAPVSRREQPSTPVAQTVVQQPQQAPITVTFENTPLDEVLATFAAFSGRSIVSGEGVEGSVNATITNQPWDIALREILRAHGFVAEETESGIIRVEELGTARQRANVEPVITRQFRIQYISVDSIVQNAIQGILTDSGRVTISPATNTLIVTDRQSVVERLAPIIQELDVRTPQVTVSAKIIFVDRTALEELGVVYDIKDSQGNQLNRVFPGFLDDEGDGLQPDDATDEDVVLLGGASIAALANATNRLATPTVQVLSSLVLGRHTLVTFLEALQTLQLTDIQAVPSIRVLDNRSARVQVGERTPVRVLDQGTAGGAGGPRATVNIEETGIILEVTPHVVGNQVLMQIHAERSNIALAPSDIGVTFQTQEAQTEVLLDNGETAVISGLTITEKSTSRSGIPFLMDLPVIGTLFRTTQERENKRDLLIMVTPHIDRTGVN